MSDSTRPARTHQLQALRVSSSPTVDGRLNEAAWDRADSATDFQQIRPSPGAPPSRRTVVRVLYDDKNLYVGARMYDDPDSIAAQTLGRDETGYTDRFTVSVGSYDNDRNAFVFRVGPAESRLDQFLSSDTNTDASWDGVWTAETNIDSLGWTAELRIPLSQLRYSEITGDTTATWGLNFRREIARHNEVVSWAPLAPNVDRRVSLFGSLRNLRDLSSSQNLEIRPYTAGLVEQSPSGSALRDPTELSARVGGDIRYGLTPNVSLRATINPDFGQVEADPSRINLTAFETFFPERRPFFVEGSDIFDVQGARRLFYSRRIGRQPQGTVPDSAGTYTAPDRTTILGAAKLTGRTAGSWEIGAIEAVTSQESATFVDESGDRGQVVVEPTTNYAVARVRKNLRGGRSTIGGIVTATNRPGLEARLSDELHRAAYVGGLDGRHRFGNETYEVSGSLLGSQVRGSPAALRKTQTSPVHYYQRPDAAHLSVDSARTRLSGWQANGGIEKIAGRWRWDVSVGATSPGFETNDLGYLRRSDVVSSHAGLRYLDVEKGSLFRRVRGRLLQYNEWTFGGTPTRRYLMALLGGTFRNHHSLNGGVQTELPTFSTTQLRGGPALRTNGYTNVFVNYNSDPRKSVQYGLFARVQTFLGTDGYIYGASPELRYRPTSRLEISVEPDLDVTRDPSQYVQRVTDGGQTKYVFGEIHQKTLGITTRASYSFTPKITLQVYAQPFISSADYGEFAVVDNPAASDFANRFDQLGSRATYNEDQRLYRVDADRDGTSDYAFIDPDFTFQQLRSTMVFRWQYRQGSTLYLVWNRGRTRRRGVARFDPASGLGHLVQNGSNTFTLKLNFWLGT